MPVSDFIMPSPAIKGDGPCRSLLFIAGLAIGLWTIHVKVPANESTPQTSVSTSGSGNAKAAEKAQKAEDGAKSGQSDELTEDKEKGGEE